MNEKRLLDVIYRMPEFFKDNIIPGLGFDVGDSIEYVYHHDDGSFYRHRMKIMELFCAYCSSKTVDVVVKGKVINERGQLTNHDAYFYIDKAQLYDCVECSSRKLTEEEAGHPFVTDINLLKYKVESSYLSRSGKKERLAVIRRHQILIADLLKKKNYDSIAKFLMKWNYYSNDIYKVLESSDTMVKLKLGTTETTTISLK